MNNPCNHCIVRSCCSELCNNKKNYGDYLLNELDKILKPYYNQKKQLSIKELNKKKIITKNLDMHRDEIQNIITKPYNLLKRNNLLR